jgi:hypothetical protein
MYASSSFLHASDSGCRDRGMRTLMGSGVMYFCGRMAARGMPIARRSVSAKVIV